MINNKEACYAALKSKDPRFDGRFFVGVSSTGIYCRPICRAKLPKLENCSFFATAAEAEKAGFRPCLQCRPELAPGTAPVYATASLAQRAARILEENCGTIENLAELANYFGCTDRHLRRAFASEYNVSPVQYLQTCRLLLAKNLLTDTKLSVLDVAMAAGFGSLRRFNDLFKKQYRLSPTALRKQVGSDKDKNFAAMTLQLGYRPPYQWQQILDFLAQRAISGIETISDGKYFRTVHLTTKAQKSVYGWVGVGNMPEKHAVTVTVSSSLLPVLPQVLAKVRHLFDLNCDPDVVYETLSSMNEIRSGLCVHGIRLPGCFDPYELAIRAVLGQQITVKAASTLAGRFAQSYGASIQTRMDGLTHAFPTPEAILALDGSIGEHLGPLGIIAARAKTILELSKVFVQGSIDFSVSAQPEIEIKKMMDIPGIGAWTAQYIAMRALGWTDAFPDTDHAVKKTLKPLMQKEILALAENWRPWRGYATINLWNSLKDNHSKGRKNMYYITHYDSPVGRLTLASDGENLVGLWIEGQKYFVNTIDGEMTEKDLLPVFSVVKEWIDKYFAGEKTDISELPLAPIGGEFRQAVWKILCEIPYGEITTYGEIAKKVAVRLNKSKMSAQAVGGAVGHNPISIIIPCHRVVGSNGSLTGYAGGISTKVKLLELEGTDMSHLYISKKGTAL